MKLTTIILLLFCFSATSFAQKHTISGYVKDQSTGEYLIGATVYVSELEKGVVTNVYGFYSLTIPAGDYTVKYSYIGYQETVKSISLTEDARVNIDLSNDEGITMDEFVVEGEKTKNTDGTQMGTIELEVEKIKTLPAFMGEVDIIKTVQFLPGVQSAGEGNTGFYVRGGGPDQNLILLDEATVYNASHLFGFFSVFNADAVKNIEMIKGGMPANYGGRLASVLDINMKDGNTQEFHGSGGIGLISSRLTLEGPIKKDTSSFIISGRRTYIDVLMKPFINDSSAFSGTGYYFYDLNAKVNYKLSDNDRLFLSGYFGKDVFNFNDKDAGFNIKVPWGNATASLRWNHLFSDKLFLNTTAIFSDYNFSFEAGQSEYEFKLLSGIQDWNAKMDFAYFPSLRHNIKFGLNYTYHIFTPSSVSAKAGETDFDTGGIVKMFANEGAVYVLDDFDVTENLKVNLGLRASAFQHIGPFKRYVKNDLGQTDTILNYEQFENIKTYGGLEPRVSMRYKFNDGSSVKAGFTHNYQYIHLASISSVSLPTDVWFPSSDIVKPQIGTQYSAGYFRNFKEDLYEASVELYYKNLKNLIEYKEGAAPDDNVNDNVDNQLTFGNGYSYGAEFFLKKRLGKFNGWTGYTWSKTMRTFEAVNNGEEFPAKYDRRHDFSLVLTYELSEKITFGAVFVYATGNTATLPIARYYSLLEDRSLTIYGDRNGYRMPAYHRADFSVTYTSPSEKTYVDKASGETMTKKKRIQSSWNLSVYNLYNRANPYFIYFSADGDLTQGTLDVGAYQVSLFPILPSITWNFKF